MKCTKRISRRRKLHKTRKSKSYKKRSYHRGGVLPVTTPKNAGTANANVPPKNARNPFATNPKLLKQATGRNLSLVNHVIPVSTLNRANPHGLPKGYLQNLNNYLKEKVPPK